MTAGIQQLVESFREEAAAHSRATLEGDHRAANRAATKVHKLFLRLIATGNEGRLALLTLAETTADDVAVLAATYSLKFNPERSLRVLARLTSDRGVIGFQAGQAIKRWKSGEWHLE